MANYDNYVIQGNTLDAIASEVKTLADTSDKISPNEMSEKLAQANTDVETQTDLIAQIKTALNGKASGGPIKEEQEKTIDITENGTTEIFPDEGKTLSKVTVNVAIESGGGGTEEIENIIDASGVLGTTDGTVTDKVEQLIEKAEDENTWYSYSEVMTSMSKWASVQAERLPRMSLKNVTSLIYTFSEMPNLKSVDFYLNTEKATNLSSTFQGCQSLKYIKGINTAKAITVHDIFANCTVLETIEEPLDFSSITATSIRPFANCAALKNIRLVPETIKISIIIPSPVLSIGNVFDLTDTENVGSVQSIINGLITLAEGAAAQTLTLSKNLPLTAEQKQAITIAVNNKGWTLAFA